MNDKGRYRQQRMIAIAKPQLRLETSLFAAEFTVPARDVIVLERRT
jgi:hypothetical protein